MVTHKYALTHGAISRAHVRTCAHVHARESHARESLASKRLKNLCTSVLASSRASTLFPSALKATPLAQERAALFRLSWPNLDTYLGIAALASAGCARAA